MIESLDVRNFTVFPVAQLKFAPGLNVLIGTNGTGKTHVLKLAYSALSVSFGGARDSGVSNPTKAHLQLAIAQKLVRVFRPDQLGRLARRSRAGRQRAEVRCRFEPSKNDLAFSFNTASESEVTVEKTPSAWIDKRPVYLPTRELLTVYPGFVSLYELHQLPFDETWRDTCLLLGAPLARGPREKTIGRMLAPLEAAMEGKVELKEPNGFYLNSGGVRTEMHLVAEGMRKLATVARLIATGSLIDKGYLFWDEPEANLNPRTIKVLAGTILHLCRSGIQVFIATHSLFLMRELDMLLRAETDVERVPARFFGLQQGDDGVVVEQGASVDDIKTIDSLDEELSQSGRFLEAEARDAAAK